MPGSSGYMRPLVGTALAVIALAICAVPAQAAFPGAPGRIAFFQGDTGGLTP
jgi:hypothetical protein